MPYHFEFDPTNQILRGPLEGRVTDEDLREYYRTAERLVARMYPRGAITDTSDATSFDVSPDTIRELAKLPPAMSDPARPRVIVAPNPQIYGMARMFEMQGEGTRPSLHVVRTQAEAWAILGVHDPQFAPLPD